MSEFDASFLCEDRVKRERHGCPWTQDDYSTLDKLARLQFSLPAMCQHLQRPPAGVIPKLLSRRHIRPTDNGYEWVDATPIETQTQTQTEEPTMNKHANITTQVLIRGRDAATMSDAEIFKLIASLEQEIDALCAIRAKSTKLQAAVDALRADVATLVAYVDGR